jgi:hypothetical protein
MHYNNYIVLGFMLHFNMGAKSKEYLNILWYLRHFSPYSRVAVVYLNMSETLWSYLCSYKTQPCREHHFAAQVWELTGSWLTTELDVHPVKVLICRF